MDDINIDNNIILLDDINIDVDNPNTDGYNLLTRVCETFNKK